MNNEDKATKLAQGIANARKVMQKVEGNTSYSNQSNGSLQQSYNEKQPEYISEEEMRARVQSKNNGPKNTMKNLDSSKMPKDILESFINNPIMDPTVPVGLDSVISKVNENNTYATIQDETEPTVSNIINESTPETKISGMDTKLIEYIIKKTVEETLEQVNKQTPIDENIQIRLGEKTFGGKIVSLKENNKKK